MTPPICGQTNIHDVTACDIPLNRMGITIGNLAKTIDGPKDFSIFPLKALSMGFNIMVSRTYIVLALARLVVATFSPQFGIIFAIDPEKGTNL